MSACRGVWLLPLAVLPLLVCGEKPPAVPTLHVSLDLEPEHRWKDIGSQFAAQIRAIAQVVTQNHGLMLKAVERLIQLESSEHKERWFPNEQFREMRGLSASTGVSFAEVVALNLFYDLTANQGPFGFAACTSIITESKSGEIVHGRNLDYDPELLEALADAVAVVHFQRRGRTVYSAVSILGMVGFNTAVKPGAFALSHDERDKGPMALNLLDIFVRQRAATFSLLRQVADNAPSFDGAVKMLREAELQAPSYFIVSGVAHGEGALITRNRDATLDVFSLNTEAGRWYILETNYDHAGPPEWGDNRRAPAERFLNATGSAHFSSEEMQAALSNREANRSRGERPTLNDDTLYSAVMRAGAPSMLKVTLRVRGSPLDVII